MILLAKKVDNSDKKTFNVSGTYHPDLIIVVAIFSSLKDLATPLLKNRIE
jgi:hypothetical protein